MLPKKYGQSKHDYIPVIRAVGPLRKRVPGLFLPSALMAILRDEPEAVSFAKSIEAQDSVISAGAVIEAIRTLSIERTKRFQTP